MLGAIKLLKLGLLTFVFVQFLTYWQKIFVLQTFTVDVWMTIFLLFFVFVFPLLYLVEKFYSTGFVSSMYERDEPTSSMILVKEKLALFSWPLDWWMVYLFSQARLFIDVALALLAGFFLFFISGFTFIQVVFSGTLFIAAIMICIKIWRTTTFVFAFWNSGTGLVDSLRESYEFTNQARLPVLSKFFTFRLLEVAIIAVLLLPVYTYSLHVKLYNYLASLVGDSVGFYMTTAIVIISACVIYLFLSLFDSIFWQRVFAFSA
jgi:hypothetical protein